MRKLALLTFGVLLFALVLPTNGLAWQPPGSATTLGSQQGRVTIGSRVQAPWSRSGQMYPGQVSSLYGKLALIDFDDGDQGWADVTRLRPAGVPRITPTDSCRVRIGEKVRAPWSRSGQMYPGIVSEVHGNLARVDFDDGDQGWALCSTTVVVRPVAISGPVRVGTRVMAPWSRTGHMYVGTVQALYGKLARIDFDDGDRGWAEVTQLRPSGTASRTPTDSCSVRRGEQVTAPWSRSGRMYPGVVSEVHGKLARIDFDDGDRGWALCSETRGQPPIGTGPVVVGSRVMAPWSAQGRMYPGRVTELYGKLANIDFDDGDQGWADVTQLNPRGIVRPAPRDTCGFGEGQPVMAPWSRAKTMYPGRVRLVHGKLAQIDFDDGDRGWALCREMRSK